MAKKRGSATLEREPVSQAKPDALGEVVKDLQDVGKGAALLHLTMGFFLVGAQPSLVRLFANPTVFTGDTAQFYLATLSRSAPLTLSVAITSIIAWFMAKEEKDLTNIVMPLLMVGSFVISMGLIIGNYWHLGLTVEQRQICNLSFPIGALVNAFYSYYASYGLSLFLTSLVVGVYLAFVWIWKIVPRFQG